MDNFKVRSRNTVPADTVPTGSKKVTYVRLAGCVDQKLDFPSRLLDIHTSYSCVFMVSSFEFSSEVMRVECLLKKG